MWPDDMDPPEGYVPARIKKYYHLDRTFSHDELMPSSHPEYDEIKLQGALIVLAKILARQLAAEDMGVSLRDLGMPALSVKKEQDTARIKHLKANKKNL